LGITATDDFQEIDELKDLFPDELILFPIFAQGQTIHNGDIVIDSRFFNEKEDMVVVKVTFVLIHEMAHRKRMLKFADLDMHQRFRTPVTQNIIKDIGTGTTGTLIEKYAFGGRIITNIKRRSNKIYGHISTKTIIDPFLKNFIM